MPIHEYRCKVCGYEFEELVFGSQVPACPKCSKADCEKLMSCARFNMPAPSRAGQTVTFPKSSGGSACGGCPGGNCASCG